MTLALALLLLTASPGATFTPADLVAKRIPIPAQANLPNGPTTLENEATKERCDVRVESSGPTDSAFVPAQACPALWATNTNPKWRTPGREVEVALGVESQGRELDSVSCWKTTTTAFLNLAGFTANEKVYYLDLGPHLDLRKREWRVVTADAGGTALIEVSRSSCPNANNPVVVYSKSLGKDEVGSTTTHDELAHALLSTAPSDASATARLQELMTPSETNTFAPEALQEVLPRGICKTVRDLSVSDEVRCRKPTLRLGVDGILSKLSNLSTGCVQFEANTFDSKPCNATKNHEGIIVGLRPSKAPKSKSACFRLRANQAYDLTKLWHTAHDDNATYRVPEQDPVMTVRVFETAKAVVARAKHSSQKATRFGAAARLDYLANMCALAWHDVRRSGPNAELGALLALGDKATPGRQEISAHGALRAYEVARAKFLAPHRLEESLAARGCMGLLSLLPKNSKTRGDILEGARKIVTGWIPSAPTKDSDGAWKKFRDALTRLETSPTADDALEKLRIKAYAGMVEDYALTSSSAGAFWLPRLQTNVPLVDDGALVVLLPDSVGLLPKWRTFEKSRLIVAATGLPRDETRTLAVFEDGKVVEDATVGKTIAAGLRLFVRGIAASTANDALESQTSPRAFTIFPSVKKTRDEILSALAQLPVEGKYETSVKFREIEGGHAYEARICKSKTCDKKTKQEELSTTRRTEVRKKRLFGLVTEAGINGFIHHPSGGYAYQPTSTPDTSQTFYELGEVKSIEEGLAVSELLTLRFLHHDQGVLAIGLGPTLYAGGNFKFGRQWNLRFLYEHPSIPGISLSTGPTLRWLDVPVNKGERIRVATGEQPPASFGSTSEVDFGYFIGIGIDATVLAEAASAVSKAVQSK